MRAARVIFCMGDGHMILLHGFIKKTQKTPQVDIDLALKRDAAALVTPIAPRRVDIVGEGRSILIRSRENRQQVGKR